MKFLLIGGQPNTGKSRMLERLFLFLRIRYSNTINAYPSNLLPPARPFNDFSVLLMGQDRLGQDVKVLIHSATDDMDCIDGLKKSINTFQPDIVVCAIRDIGWERVEVMNIIGNNFFTEIPLARITRRGKQKPIPTNYSRAILWYQNCIDNIVNLVIEHPPFNL